MNAYLAYSIYIILNSIILFIQVKNVHKSDHKKSKLTPFLFIGTWMIFNIIFKVNHLIVPILEYFYLNDLIILAFGIISLFITKSIKRKA